MLKELIRWDAGMALPAKESLNIHDAGAQSYIRRLYEAGTPYHAWLSVWRHFARWEGTFLDVGANMGQSITSFAIFNPRMRIWSFEPNPLCAENMQFAAGLVPNEVTLFLCGIAAEDATLPLHVPVLRGSQSLGPSSNASLRRSELDKGFVRRRLLGVETDETALTFAEVPAVVRRLDSIGDPPDFRLGKIDVEGFERQALEGMTPAIRRHRPVLTVERNNWHEVKEWLAREGYGAFDYDAATATLHRDTPERSGKMVDPVLLPLERVAEIVASAEGLSLAT